MAIRGRKPTASMLKMIRGNPGRRPMIHDEIQLEGRAVKPGNLRGAPAQVWKKYIDRAPAKMVTARIAQPRALGSELGLDPSALARLETPAPEDPVVANYST